ncbi:F-box/kelch-repeat protein [Vitis vinifera]|uniref:F-box/kelch-repeat protein n=1 Tax=Vitis vinifera TaxID=29760 RepID=A0A438EZS6_VITVI|nr:F-box/kelch-repeat protein [Vitis vinifera]
MEWEEGFLLSRIILACSARQVHYWKQSLALTTRAEEETLSIALMASLLRPWSNLPDEILVMLFKRLLHICDRIRFRAVCKGWRLPVRLIQGLFPIPKLPWTMEYMWKKTTDSNRTSSICKLREPDLHQGSSASRSYIVENGMMEGRSNFVDAEACASRDGWVLFSKEEGKGSLLFFFFSPFTKAVISLPHLESPGFEVATFSSAPTFPDCVVFVTHPPESGKISISICRPCGDDRTWNGSIFRVPEFFDSVESVAYMGGSFYCHFGCFYRMTSFNAATKKWSEGELLLAYAAKDRYSLYPGEYDDEWFLLYKLDWKRKAWRNKGRLRGWGDISW